MANVRRPRPEEPPIETFRLTHACFRPRAPPRDAVLSRSPVAMRSDVAAGMAYGELFVSQCPAQMTAGGAIFAGRNGPVPAV